MQKHHIYAYKCILNELVMHYSITHGILLLFESYMLLKFKMQESLLGVIRILLQFVFKPIFFLNLWSPNSKTNFNKCWYVVYAWCLPFSTGHFNHCAFYKRYLLFQFSVPIFRTLVIFHSKHNFTFIDIS